MHYALATPHDPTPLLARAEQARGQAQEQAKAHRNHSHGLPVPFDAATLTQVANLPCTSFACSYRTLSSLYSRLLTRSH